MGGKGRCLNKCPKLCSPLRCKEKYYFNIKPELLKLKNLPRLFLNLHLSIYVKIFEIYLVTQSL
jgi:hypothetical protein